MWRIRFGNGKGWIRHHMDVRKRQMVQEDSEQELAWYSLIRRREYVHARLGRHIDWWIPVSASVIRREKKWS